MTDRQTLEVNIMVAKAERSRTNRQVATSAANGNGMLQADHYCSFGFLFGLDAPGITVYVLTDLC